MAHSSAAEAGPAPAWASTTLSRLIDGPRLSGRVLGATSKVTIALVGEAGNDPQVLALLAPAAVRLPLGIVLSGGMLPGASSTVQVGEGRISDGERVWRVARWWDPTPRLPAQELRRQGAALLGLVRSESETSFGLAVSRAVGVAGALAAGDGEAALGVLGLGPGLTPAGDDVVAGALAVLALAGQRHGDVGAFVAAQAWSRTSLLSAALLGLAARGQVIPEAAAVLKVLAAGAAAAPLAGAVSELFQVGATSGHAMCAGMAGALAALSQSGNPGASPGDDAPVMTAAPSGISQGNSGKANE